MEIDHFKIISFIYKVFLDAKPVYDTILSSSNINMVK